MSNIYREKHQEALLSSLYKRVKNRLLFLNSKKHSLLNRLVEKSDEAELQKIREDILKQ